MKKTLLLLLSLITFSACGQSKNEKLKENHDLFILLKNKNNISLNQFRDNKIVEIEKYKISKNSIYKTDNFQKVIIIDTTTNKLSIFDITTKNETKLNIPFKIKPKTITIDKNNVFIGGELEEEMLIQYNIKTQKWFALEIPTQVLFPRKAIDDLLLNDTLLIAIDNLVMPKYILYYHLNSDERLSLSHFKELKSNGTYESIYKGKLSSQYLGLLSGTYSGYVGSTEHITIYKDLELSKSFAISTNHNDKNYRSMNDILIIDDDLIIASSENGLGIFNIKDSYFTESENDFGNFNSNIDSKKIKYKSYKNENIISLTQIPNTKKVILTIKEKNNRIKHQIIDI